MESAWNSVPRIDAFCRRGTIRASAAIKGHDLSGPASSCLAGFPDSVLA